MINAVTDFQARFDVSRETMNRLSEYEGLIRKWTKVINLVAASTIDHIWTRHFTESAQMFEVANQKSGLWLDMGSGGGFPGAVVAIFANELAPELRVTCIESDIRKCEFLRTVARTTGVKLSVVSRRVEETPPQNAEVVSARALSNLERLLEYSNRHLAPGGCAVYLKGETWKQEVEDARGFWTFDLEMTTSLTNVGSALLKLRNIERV